MKYTIIITIYNKEKYLESAIESACKQSYKKYEVIVINDGSTDRSEEIILKLKNKFNFKYYKKENSGVADTRNYAIEKVKTPYFLFLDADDYLEKDLLKEVNKYNNYDILSFNAINKDENDNIIKYINKPNHKGNGEMYINKLVENKSEFTVPWGYIYNKNYFKKHHFLYPKGEILEDFYLTPFILAEANNIISIDYYGYKYVTNSNSIINSKKNIDKITKTYLNHLKKMLEKIIKSNYSINLKNDLKHLIAAAIIWYGSTLSKKERNEYIKEVKKLNVISNLKRGVIKKLIIRICYNLNIYYIVRKYYCKFYINKFKSNGVEYE